MKALAAILLVAIGCGENKKAVDAAVAIDAKSIDAPVIDAPMIDAPPPTALTVDCATVTPAAIIMTTDGVFAYQPATATIALNDVVKFQMSSIHNVVPNATMSDTGLHVGFAETKCLKFTLQGTFNFHCQPHGFLGSVTVN